MAGATETTLGPIDILVTSAGIAPVVAAHRARFRNHWRRVMEVNLDGTFLSIMAVQNRA